MRISATGISANDARRGSAGFTLIEILVVMLIIGIMIAGAVLSTNAAGGGDREIEKERDRILGLTDYLRDQAALQNREYGMRVFEGGYEFVVLDAPSRTWFRLDDDKITQTRKLPEGLAMTLQVEGRQIVLPAADVLPDEMLPQIMLYSSGDMNEFKLVLERTSGRSFEFAPVVAADRIEATEIRIGK